MDAEEYPFYKDVLPKGLSYPLKRSLLDEALHAAGVYHHLYDVQYRKPDAYRGSSDSWLLLAMRISDHAEGNVDRLSPGKVKLVVRAVASNQRAEVAALLSEDGLPRLIGWLTSIDQRPETWRDQHQVFEYAAQRSSDQP